MKEIIKEINLSSSNFLFVKVPNDAYFVKEKLGYIFEYESFDLKSNKVRTFTLEISGNNKYKFIFTTKDITEEESEKIIDILFRFPRRYANYLKPIEFSYDILLSAKESLKSLIKANNLDITKNYLILKKLK